jgi:hypothetical protein
VCVFTWALVHGKVFTPEEKTFMESKPKLKLINIKCKTNPVRGAFSDQTQTLMFTQLAGRVCFSSNFKVMERNPELQRAKLCGPGVNKLHRIITIPVQKVCKQ